MNILFIENAGTFSAGAFHSLITLIEELKKYGVNSFVALPKQSVEGQKILAEKGIEFIALKSCAYSQMIDSNASFVEKLKMLIKDNMVKLEVHRLINYANEKKIDIVHENTSVCYMGYYVTKKLSLKHVWHIREFLEEDFGKHLWKKNRALKMFNEADQIITVSDATKDKYSKLLKNPSIQRIYNGVDIDRFYFPNHSILQNEKIKLVSVGRVCEGKGQLDIVKAIGILKKQYNINNFQLRLVGKVDSEYYSVLKKVIIQFSLEDVVSFDGQVTDVESVYKDSDVFCMSSKNEAFGKVTIEAMCAGCFVVGLNSGGTTEIIDDSVTGLLYNDNVNSLVNKLIWLNENRKQAIKIALNGQKKALRHFSSDLFGQNVYNVYKKLVKDR